MYLGILLILLAIYGPTLSQQCGGCEGAKEGRAAAKRAERAAVLRWCTKNCASEWGQWGSCDKQCGGGDQTRTRSHLSYEWCSDIGHRCDYVRTGKRECNQGCGNPRRGTPKDGWCACYDEWYGTCCDMRRTCSYRTLFNGHIESTWPAYVNSVAEFACEEGFDLNGTDFTICGKDGWSLNEWPTCKPIECDAPDTTSANVIMWPQKPNGYSFGDIIGYRCKRGYTLLGHEFRECERAPGGDGRFSGIDPICQAIECDDPGEPLHGTRGLGDTVYNSVLTFGCNAGYKLVGSSSMRCLASGNWLGHFPECIEIDCAPPAQQEHARIEIRKVNNVQTAIFLCDEGYKINPSVNTTITCGPGGWNENPPICQAVDCGEVAMHPNAYKQGSGNTYPNSWTFSCAAGHEMHGEAVITCLESATWSHPPPTCTACTRNTYAEEEECIACPANSHTNAEASPSIEHCACDMGYDGTPTTRCVQILCRTLSAPTFGQMLPCENTVGESCHFSCNDGYVMESGSSIRTCQINGAWDGTRAGCQACPMDTYKSEENERSCLHCPVNSHTDAVAQTRLGCKCDDGFNGTDGGPCPDADECLEDPCEDECNNVPGTYVCRCNLPGYKVDPANITQCIIDTECRTLTVDDAPDNGGLVCKAFIQRNSKYCEVLCNNHYEHTARVNNYELCGPDTNYTWSFQQRSPTAKLPPCIEEFYPGYRSEVDTAYFTTACSSLTSDQQVAVKESFADRLSAAGVCKRDGNSVCDISDMTIVCGRETRRRRRGTEEIFEESLDLLFNMTGLRWINSSDECGADICSLLNLPAQYCTNELCLRVYKRFIRASLTFADQLVKDLYNDAENMASVTVEAFGHVFLPELGGATTSGILVECKPGMQQNEDVCLPCPVGTFLSEHNKTCVACPVMTYQDEELQEECKTCPTGTFNIETGSADCQICPEGKYGRGCVFNCDCEHGTCDPVIGQCTCTNGWEGMRCDVDIPGCRNQQCASSVTCHDVPAPNTGITCGPCPPGTHGDGFNCAPINPGALIDPSIFS